MNGKFISAKSSDAKITAKAIKKQNKVWNPEYKMTSIEVPELTALKNTKKRFKIAFTYLDEKTGKKHRKSVNFGDKNK